MTTLNRLSVTNFRASEQIILDLHPGVNALVGPSDVGKTHLLINSIRWVVSNRPLSEPYRSRWGGPTEVELEFEDVTVKRHKDKENLYFLNGRKLEGFGTDVPDIVTEALNFDPVSMQRQLEGHFLLKDSPGEVARQLNRAAGLDEIDRSVRFLSKLQHDTSIDVTRLKGRKGSKKVKEIKGEIPELFSQLSALGWLDDIEIALGYVEGLEDSIKADQARARDLENALDAYNRCKERLDQLPDLAAAETLIAETRTALSAYNGDRERADALEQALDTYEDTQKAVTRCKKAEKAAGEVFKEAFPGVCPLCGKPKS